ncbi:hypothetical protein ACFO3J_24590 [Streptomyces polygonati]|uniref:CHAD domain-containing protein n=1 Tax=Streptomyces polygonati TaxID=1617087 RepID=A0ABV8HSE9_9ACTN
MYEKAKQLEDHATRIADGEEAARHATRVSSRLLELRGDLNTLKIHVGVARALQKQGAGTGIDLSGLDDGRAVFERGLGHSGLPTNQLCNSARKKIQAVAERIREANQVAWSAWTRELLDDLPVPRIAMLAPDLEQGATGRLAELERLAKGKVAKDVMTAFATTHAGLAELLAEEADPPEALASLLRRLRQQPGLALADVSDSEIALLREYSMDKHITLKRKGL